MSFWVLTQILINVILLAGVVILWAKLNRPAKDDPRLSRGLQLLQSKISVLEDLSDRTETQVSQLNTLMENKCKEIQDYLIKADHQVQNIEASMLKSKEVAKIFQDKIPHEEIIERQNTLKYVKAARLAHQGFTTQEISREVDLPFGELDFIAKLNREQLQFSETDLPEWAKGEETASLESLGERFRQAQAAQTAAEPVAEMTGTLQNQMSIPQNGFQRQKVTTEVITEPVTIAPAAAPVKAAEPQPEKISPIKTRTTTLGIQKVVFPRVEPNNNLG